MFMIEVSHGEGTYQLHAIRTTIEMASYRMQQLSGVMLHFKPVTACSS